MAFTKDLNTALRDAFPRTGLPYPYSNVYCLLLRWESDDLSIQDEIDDLAAVLEHRLYFEVEQWRIPDDDPMKALQKTLYNFQDLHQGEDELLIVYYGGHGKPDRYGCSKWCAYVYPTALPCPSTLVEMFFPAHCLNLVHFHDFNYPYNPNDSQQLTSMMLM